MKRIITLFITAITLTSCSNDSNNTSSKKIQKVVFYRNSSNERQWNINDDLLRNITLADGTLAEEFTYDNLNRVIKDIKYNDGSISEVNDITYNADNTIKSINGLPYTFDAATNTYDYTYGSSFTISCQVNSDKLALNYTRTGTDAKEYHMAYVNGNMTSFEKSANGTADVVKNFHFDTNVNKNPIAAIILPVARVKSLIDPEFFIDSQSSKSVAVGFDLGNTSPYYFNYGFVSDTNYLQIGIEVMENNNAVDWMLYTEYYYQ